MTSTRRRSAGFSLALVVCLAALAGVVAPHVSSDGGREHVEQVAAQQPQPWWASLLRTATTTAKASTTTTAVPTTTASPTTTAPPAPPTTAAPAVPTTRAPQATPPRPRPTPTTEAPAAGIPSSPVGGDPGGSAPVSTIGGALSAVSQRTALALVNATRATGASCGGSWFPAVPALTLNAQLGSSASAFAADMASADYFSHTGRDGSDPGARIGRAGYSWTAWAENIAAGQPDVSSVIAGWFASAGHCENFMSPNVTQVGFGMAQNPSSTYRIYWVADLGRP